MLVLEMQPRLSQRQRRTPEQQEHPRGKGTQAGASGRRVCVRATAAVGGLRGGALSWTGAGPQEL